MIKNVKPIFVVLVFSSLISFSFNERSTSTEKLPLGEKAPELVLGDNDKQLLSLQNPSGDYTLLSFWASYDAVSRMENAQLNQMTKHSARVKMISISFDTYRSVYQAAIKQDGINASNCHWEMEGEKSPIFKSYDLKGGFKNYLLDKDGVIIAKNLTADDLVSYLN